MRQGRRLEFELSLEALPNQDKPELPTRAEAPPSVDSTLMHLGLSAKSLDDELARQLGASSAAGVVITEILEASPARGAGLRERDVVLEVGPDPVADSESFYQAVDAIDPGEIVRFKIMRGGRAAYVAFER